MSEFERQAMRGLLDIVLGGWLISRFCWHSAVLPGWRARWAQLTIITLLLALLEWLGVWNWQELVAAFKLFPVMWPVVILLGYFIYRTLRLSRSLARAEFEIDWRREYQEVLMEQLTERGQPIPPPRTDAQQ